MLNLSGNLCEMGDLEEVASTSRGLRIERPDGRVVTITGLTKEEVQALQLFENVTLSVAAQSDAASQQGERDRAAAYVKSHVEWEHCDCGCPNQRAPKTAADVQLLRLAGNIRMGKHAATAEVQSAPGAQWPHDAAFVDLASGEFLDDKARTLAADADAMAAPKRRHNVLEMLGYELDGVLADLRDGQGGQLDTVCQQTITRVRQRLHEFAQAARSAKLPLLPAPHWPRFYEGSVPAGAFTKDQMHAYAVLTLAAFVAQRGVDEALRPVLQRAFAALAALHLHAKEDDRLRGPVWCAEQSLAELRQLLGDLVIEVDGDGANA